MKSSYALIAAAALSFLSGQAVAAPEGQPDMPPHEKGGHWKKMDTNGDGAISKDEFTASAEERFKTMDTNADGTLSKEELQAHREKMRDHYREMKKMRMERKGEADKATETPAKPAAEEKK